MNIIFVCTGNICRSPMAEGYFKFLCAKEGREDIKIQSAGVSATTGTLPSFEAVKVAKNAGFDISSHRSKSLSRELANWADFIIVMTANHKISVQYLFPHFKSKRILMLNEFIDPAKDVSDPIGGGLDAYKACFSDIKKGLDILFKFIDKLESI